MVGFEARLVRFENTGEGFGTASFDGSGDVADNVGVRDGRRFRGVVRKRAGCC